MTDNQKKTILVIGAGAVGAIAALNLEIGGHASVTVALRSNYDAVNEHGYTIDSCDHGSLKEFRPSVGGLQYQPRKTANKSADAPQFARTYQTSQPRRSHRTTTSSCALKIPQMSGLPRWTWLDPPWQRATRTRPLCSSKTV